MHSRCSAMDVGLAGISVDKKDLAQLLIKDDRSDHEATQLL